MLPKEQPPAPRSEEQFAGLMGSLEAELAKDRPSLKNLWMKTGDIVRDIDTANTMAKGKFEGDSALMHVARGAVTTGVGVGLEKAMDFVWEKVWTGEIPFYDKSKFGSGMAKAMNKFAGESDRKARLTYFIKEGTQDMSVALFYNFMAFRSQPILPKAGPEHLVRSLGADALEAMLAPTLPQDVKIQTQQSQINVQEYETEEQRKKWRYLDRATGKSSREVRGEDGRTRFEPTTFPLYPAETLREKNKLSKMATQLKHLKVDLRKMQSEYHPSPREDILRTYLHHLNPVTMLGGEWMIDGVAEFIRNYKDVRKARAEKGGLAGKKVLMPKKEEPWKRDNKKPYQERRQWEKRDYSKDKVYYGKAKSDEQKLEEYELKGG